MKGICGEQLNNCMLLGDCENSEHGTELPGDFTGEPVETESGGGMGGSLALAARRIRSRQVHSMAVRSGSAYDTLERPYRHDKCRGRWAKSADFYFASCTHAFSSLIFSELSTFGILHGGWLLFIIAYLMGMLFYSLPIFLIQAFLGQFSSSGTISAFRVAPIFKGIGYAILLLNLGTLTYYSIGAVVPLIYTVNSIHPVIPWMSCNNSWNTQECSLHENYDVDDYRVDPHSTVESTIASTAKGSTSMSISWSMLIGVLSIWLVVLALLLKPVAFLDSFDSILATARTALLMAGGALGPGWGSIITLSSYNNFRRDAERLSIWVCLTHITIGLMGLLCCNVAHDHFEDHVGMMPLHVDEKHHMQFLYLCFSYLFGRFTTTPNLWAFLFFGMIFLSELCALIIQMMSVVTALFDEFETLRSRRILVISTLIFCLTASSVYFCTQLGFSQLTQLPNLAVFTHLLISGILVLMTTWVYGRVRFQCDLQFMLGKTISSFKIFFIRFATPIFLGLCLFQLTYLFTRDRIHDVLIYVSQGLILLTAMSYMVYKVCRTNGDWRQRLQQCLAPHDWHPVDADNRRFYEEIMGISEMLVIDANANTT
ncbi:GD22474 [Drosophila simulans]|uniref:GD22474 n=1 Tax=Drosophila simulans TaxID=7240 RepID=B4Q5S4_DROSI|nr:GD22474 [Drosophila simulans]